MSSLTAERFISKFLSAGAFFITIFVAAWWTTEPVNGPKMLVLVMLASSCLSIIFLELASWRKTENSRVIIVCLFFGAWMILASLLSNEPLVMNFYGVAGRNTGLLTYLSLTIVFIAALVLKSRVHFEAIIKSFIFAGFFNLVYCLFSIFGVELLPWNNIFNTILGTFGNPNFISSFLGMFIAAIFTKLIAEGVSLTHRMFYVIVIVVGFVEILISQAIQGLAVSIIGVGFVVWLRIRSVTKSKLIEFTYIGLSIALGLLATLGALQIGPLAKFIYKLSVSLRGVYWSTGWNMGFTHPIFGVGPDAYGSWYRRLRTPEALITTGVDSATNAAHNVYIDIFASGGFPLLIAYSLLTGFVVRSIIRLIRRSRTFDVTGTLLSAVWIGYQAQSIISINQLGIAIWGWIFGALIIAYETLNVSTPQIGKSFRGEKQKTPKKSKSVSEPGLVMGATAGALVGLLIALPPVLVDANWRSALRSGEIEVVESAARAWPLDPFRLNEATIIFMKNNYPDIARGLVNLAVEEFPNSLISWYSFSQMPNLTEVEKALVLSNLRRLDPLNPKFK
jgi:O-antigen ligase